MWWNGRHAGLRNQCFGVQVRLLSSPPCRRGERVNTLRSERSDFGLAGANPAACTNLPRAPDDAGFLRTEALLGSTPSRGSMMLTRHDPVRSDRQHQFMLMWWNGRHARSRAWWPQGRAGSTPVVSTMC